MTTESEIEALLADVLLESNSQEFFQERFLNFLVMELFIRKLRAQGLSNSNIYQLCVKIDEERHEEQT